ncbi:hypothetical protein POTOM_033602 [Populus tomentosa]|uniref:Pentatricopeptide repeat-containing protein n=1 Tax=Populus tomentosa TaxID=118781 RepID=A0A8X8CQT9_POPTO|nr:hypothetical protein POTOM_033602 [Populus tomentosa]
MYLKNESVEEGRRAFDEMGERNVVSWTSLLTGHAQNGLNVETMDLLLRMEFKMVIKNGFGAATFACNALINMNFESRKIRDGRGVFDGLKDKECSHQDGFCPGYLVVLYNYKNTRTPLMLAYSKCGEMDSVSKILALMDDEVRNVV